MIVGILCGIELAEEELNEVYDKNTGKIIIEALKKSRN